MLTKADIEERIGDLYSTGHELSDYADYCASCGWKDEVNATLKEIELLWVDIGNLENLLEVTER